MKWIVATTLLLSACQHPSAPPPERVERVNAVGVWTLQQGGSITIDPDGTARKGDLHGAWEPLDDQVWIFWENGWIDLITPSEGAFEVKSFGPGTSLDAPPDESGVAQKK